MAENNILAMGDAIQCKANFEKDLQDLHDLIFICRGILALIPVVNWFSWIWEKVIKYHAYVTEAQYLCWTSQVDEDMSGVELDYEQFKNFKEYAESFEKIPVVGIIVQAVIIQMYADEFQAYAAALVPDMATTATA